MKLHPLKIERERRGWSQSKVAEMLGTTTRTVIRWEQGDVIPYPYYREQLCLIYGKNAEQLALIPDDNLEQASCQDPVSLSIPLESLEHAVSCPSSQDITSACNTPTFLLDPLLPDQLVRPDTLLGRERLFAQIKRNYLRSNQATSFALHGLPGIGKTTLAVALAFDEHVQAQFPDGILWAELGPQPDVISQLAHWATLLGVSPSQVDNPHSPEAWGKTLQAAIGLRHLLLLIDDAWSTEAACALRVGGPNCSYLLTTRLPQVALGFAGEKVISVPELEEEEGLRLLARFVPQLVQEDPQGARALVEAMGGLPLGLTLVGKYVALQALTQQPRRFQAALAQVHDGKLRLQISVPMAPGECTTNLPQGVAPSLAAALEVSHRQLSERAHEALCALAVFPAKPASFSEEDALAVSQQPVEILDELWDSGLLESYGIGRYCLHPIVLDYARALKEDGDDQERHRAGEEEQHHQETTASWQRSRQETFAGSHRTWLSSVSFAHSPRRFIPIVVIGSLCLSLLLTLSVSSISFFSTKTAPPTTSLTVIDDSLQGTGMNAFNYVGAGWNHCNDGCHNDPPDAYNGSNSWDNIPNDYVTVSFTGVQIKLYGVLNNRHGIGAVSIDDSSEVMIDFYAPQETGDQLLWTSPLLLAGPHTFKLRVTGDKDLASTDTCVVPDRVDILA